MEKEHSDDREQLYASVVEFLQQQRSPDASFIDESVVHVKKPLYSSIMANPPRYALQEPPKPALWTLLTTNFANLFRNHATEDVNVKEELELIRMDIKELLRIILKMDEELDSLRTIVFRNIGKN